MLIPYGGGSSVVGHINPLAGNRPVLTVNLRRLNRLLDLDKTSQLATFGAGISGPELEAHLRAHGYTLGHFPQSFEFSTLGGWIATRSSGQQSRGYGRIEDLICRRSAAGTGRCAHSAPLPRLRRRPRPAGTGPGLGRTARHRHRSNRPYLPASGTRSVPCGLLSRLRRWPGRRARPDAGTNPPLDGPPEHGRRNRNHPEARRARAFDQHPGRAVEPARRSRRKSAAAAGR